MSRFVVALLAAVAICSASFGQERESSARGQGEEARPREQAPRRQAPRRQTLGRRYGRGAMEVKDPAGFAAAQEGEVFSGPQPGEPLPPLTATSLLGEREGEQVEVVEAAGERPHLLLMMDDGGVALRGLFMFLAARR